MSVKQITNARNIRKIFGSLNEAQRRWYVAKEAIAYGRGGVKALHETTGMSRATIIKGKKELKEQKQLGHQGRIRKRGGGRKKVKDINPRMVKELEKMMEEHTAGDPMSTLKWTYKSSYKLAGELMIKGHHTSKSTVGRILKEQGYSLQANKKNKEGEAPPERDAQFHYINEQTKKFLRRRQPVISVDTKKKELIGRFKNAGKRWQKKGQPEEVNVYDFPTLATGKAVPYGAYDIALNKGFVNIGISSDTAEFAVESIRQWWKQLGKKHYPKAKELLICADAGGSNGYRNRGWKYFLNKLAKETGFKITVLHFPPATSKWNKIEHRLFSFISMNWKGKPLINYQVVITEV
ncbi:MAG: ISAzo13 family transposase [Candidatus Aenigmarchaeota archaeon]|nr:ISAzo13 family transposase [Candidatus Aenigmarchaeota archaeon]